MRSSAARWYLVLALLPLLLGAASVPFWGAHESMPADTPIASLKHGEFIWMGAAVVSGPMAMVVSLDEQRGYVYRNGVLIGVTTVSTGRPGHETPTGVFTILQKDIDHRSSIYNSAPMPYMQRLTWGGVALHAGGLPGYPESHGCVHLPSEFAKQLYAISSTGMTVVIANAATQPRQVDRPGYLVPVNRMGMAAATARLADSEEMRWQPELATDGPVSIVISRGSGRVVVYRNGVEIGRARVIFRGGEPIGTHALVLVQGPSADIASRFVRDPQHEHWVHIGIAGRMGEVGTEPDAGIASRMEIAPEFQRAVFAVLQPGATVLLTDEMLTPATSGRSLDVINADPPSSPAQ